MLTKFLRKHRNVGLRTHHDNRYRPTNRDAIVGTGNWTPLIDEAKCWAAQAVLDVPGRAPGRKAVRRHLLTGMARCGKCGATLVMSYRTDGWIVYVCKVCHGISILADNLEPTVYPYLEDRLAQPDAVDLLRDKQHDAEEAERLRTEAMRLRAEIDNIGIERAEGLLTGRQTKIATDRLPANLAKLEARQHSQEHLRVFGGPPLSTPAVGVALAKLSADRIRAVLDILALVTVQPVGKIGRAPIPGWVDIKPVDLAVFRCRTSGASPRLIGKRNVAGPTLASLGTNFGLSSLLGKPLAVISDARLGNSPSHMVVERLLSIAGDDQIDVDRCGRADCQSDSSSCPMNCPDFGIVPAPAVAGCRRESAGAGNAPVRCTAPHLRTSVRLRPGSPRRIWPARRPARSSALASSSGHAWPRPDNNAAQMTRACPAYGDLPERLAVVTAPPHVRVTVVHRFAVLPPPDVEVVRVHETICATGIFILSKLFGLGVHTLYAKYALL
jgi:hypothetical protein